MAGKSSGQEAYTNKPSAISHVLSKITPGGTRINNEEKAASGTYQVNPVTSHIALETFQTSSRKLADEESLEDRPTTAVPGVFVIAETKTAVDDRHH